MYKLKARMLETLTADDQALQVQPTSLQGAEPEAAG